ncbi:MAG: O-antigen ligase family protein [Betaproteobacteria bacterium]|nr:O-antigen ligase family protein [Betaproteobacteria bacterium]
MALSKSVGIARLTVANAASAAIAWLVGAQLLSGVFAQLSGARLDSTDMWKWMAQAIGPIVVFWPCYEWARTAYNDAPIDIGLRSVAVLAIGSVSFEAAGILSFETYGDRYFGPIGDSVAWLLCIVAPYFLFNRAIGFATLSILALLLTQSRGGAIVCVATILTMLGIQGRRRGGAARGIVVLSVVFVAGFLFSEQLSGLLNRFADGVMLESDRIETTDFTLELFETAPLLGLGYGAHTYTWSRAGYESLPLDGLFGVPTSTLAQLLADTGLFGTLPYFILFFTVVASLISLVSLVGPSQNEKVISLGVWLTCFMALNQSASWLLPSSLLAPFVFAFCGIVVGASANTPRANSRDGAIRRRGTAT